MPSSRHEFRAIAIGRLPGVGDLGWELSQRAKVESQQPRQVVGFVS